LTGRGQLPELPPPGGAFGVPMSGSANPAADDPPDDAGGTVAEQLSELDLTDQLISAGDVVRVMMVEDSDVKYQGPVSTSGTVSIPYYGEFRLAGMTEREAGRELATALEEKLYQRATVSVVLVARGPGSVYVYGAVGKPGAYSIPKFGQFTILRLMLLCGGLSGWADPRGAFILRVSSEDGTVERITVDLSEIFATAIPYSERDMTLRDGDIVCVPGLNGELFQFMTMEDREVIIIGEVNSPGPVRFSPGEPRTVMRALFKVGGFTQFAKKSSVRVFRYEDTGERTERVVDAEEIMDEGLLHKDVDLKPGDVLIVPQKKINL
jgi:polysaccharide export outer membrane protein